MDMTIISLNPSRSHSLLFEGNNVGHENGSLLSIRHLSSEHYVLASSLSLLVFLCACSSVQVQNRNYDFILYSFHHDNELSYSIFSITMANTDFAHLCVLCISFRVRGREYFLEVWNQTKSIRDLERIYPFDWRSFYSFLYIL